MDAVGQNVDGICMRHAFPRARSPVRSSQMYTRTRARETRGAVKECISQNYNAILWCVDFGCMYGWLVGVCAGAHARMCLVTAFARAVEPERGRPGGMGGMVVVVGG